MKIRDVLINNISDDYKELWGYRPRFRYDEMNLVDLKMLADQASRDLEEHLQDEYEWDLWGYECEDNRAYQEEIAQDNWDHIDDLYKDMKW
jgi:hypothetical protein